MCGRFGIPGDYVEMANNFDISPGIERDTVWETLIPRYNVAPTDQVPAIFEKDGHRYLEPMRWGLIPFHAEQMRGRAVLDRNEKTINTPINARAETVESRGSFKSSFQKRRCLIPAGGFYEWKKNGRKKSPYWLHLEDQPWMAFAGLYNWWKTPLGKWMSSCTIITTVANGFMEPIHERMPVILTEGTYDLWLDPENRDLSDLKEVLVPFPSAKMRGHRIASLVNKVQNDGPGLIEPSPSMISDQEPRLFT